jgi:2-phospho-L-lactate/phosphoenolpyruvate guanylyltransferase
VRALLVPVKSFGDAKHRLESALAPEERAELARQLAGIVLAAAGGLDAFVACDDGDVADWAVLHGAIVLWTPGLGLSGAVNTGVAHLATAGYDTVVVAHADLPLVSTFDGFGSDGIVTLAPDRIDDGTNVAAVPADAGFRFSYGPGSFGRHQAEAARLGLPLVVVRDERLGSDVDLPSDLHLVAHLLSREMPIVVAPNL